MGVPLQYPLIITRLRESGVSLAQFLDGMDGTEAMDIMNSWELWKLPYQRRPEGTWRRWLFRAGRGCGKSHTGAAETNDVAKDKRALGGGDIALIGRTSTEVRQVMIEGSSGILATAPSDFRPRWEPGNGVLRWPNGVKGFALSADKPEQIRGKNLAWVWGDEPAWWPNLHTTVMESIEPALRIGIAQAMYTTTPRRTPDLKKIEDMDDTATSRASTYQNPYLPAHVLRGYEKLFEGTRSGKQELYGEYLTENDHALWSADDIERGRLDGPPDESMFRRIVVAVDPAVTNEEDSDENGIVVAALGKDGRGYLLADKSRRASPLGWARVAVAQAKVWGADRIVAEVNNGGDMVETTVRAVDPRATYKSVRASRGKMTRAEPVAALYERGMISHCGRFPELEDQLLNWDPTQSKSPDRLDALVWAFTELMLGENEVGPLAGYLAA